MEILISIVVAVVVGFITGALVANNNTAKVSKIVEDAQKVTERVEKELAELNANQKKTTATSRKKTTTKK